MGENFKQYNNLKKIRNIRGITQKQLADMIGTVESYVTKLESGANQIGQKWIHPICMALDCTPNELFGYSEPKETFAKENFSIDEKLYEMSKEIVLQAIKNKNVNLSEDEIVTEIFHAYKIALNMKKSNVEFLPTALTIKWLKTVEEEKKEKNVINLRE